MRLGLLRIVNRFLCPLEPGFSLPQERNQLAFRPNCGRDRVERQRAARAQTEEKQRKKDEKVALRKAERVAAEAPPDDKRADDKQS